VRPLYATKSPNKQWQILDKSLGGAKFKLFKRHKTIVLAKLRPKPSLLVIVFNLKPLLAFSHG
jgi:hypothetical protein